MTRSPIRSGTALLGASALLLAGCGNDDALSSGDDGDAIVIGSQDYYSNEIVAEIYAQALEEAGHQVDRQYRIGQREAYVPQIESGKIDLFPEYSGPLLRYWDEDATATAADEVYAELQDAAPGDIRVLDAAAASDEDSYVVTAEFAREHDLRSLDQLKDLGFPLTVGANSELSSRPHGPEGLRETYGVDVTVRPVEDGGGPLTVKALKDGDIQIADVYTADPSVKSNNLVRLEDPKNLLPASRLVPLASGKLDDAAVELINAIQAQLGEDALLELNERSVAEKLPAKDIARDWLADHPVG